MRVIVIHRWTNNAHCTTLTYESMFDNIRQSHALTDIPAKLFDLHLTSSTHHGSRLFTLFRLYTITGSPLVCKSRWDCASLGYADSNAANNVRHQWSRHAD